MKITIEYERAGDLKPHSAIWKIAVQSAIERLIRTENKRTPIDDSAIVHLLGDEGFTKVKPYYVALVRQELKIPTYRRRQVGKRKDIYASAKNRKEKQV